MMPIFRVQVNMEVDTDKHETRILNQQMIDPVEVKPCPHCGNMPPVGRVYCDRKCFMAHGTRQRKKALELDPQLLIEAPRETSKRIRAKKLLPWYRRVLGG